MKCADFKVLWEWCKITSPHQIPLKASVTEIEREGKDREGERERAEREGRGGGREGKREGERIKF